MKRLIVLAAIAAASCAKSGASAPERGDDAAPPMQVAMNDNGLQQQAQTNPVRRNTLRLEPSVIIDANGFAAPMGAVTALVPHGWRTEGGVVWASDFMCTNGYNFNWSATSPDGSMRYGVAPQTGWAYATGGVPASPQPGCMTLNISSARDYLAQSVASAFPGARILDFRPRPDLVTEVSGAPQRTQMPLGELQRYSEGGEILFAFSDRGRDMRGSMAAVVQFQKMITDMSAMYNNDPTLAQMGGGAQRTESVNAYVFPGFYAVAPNGMLNLAFFDALRRSMRPNPEWSKQIAGHNTRIAQVALEEGRKRAAMIAQSNEEVARIRNETWAATQESADRRAREFGEALRGVETYADADAPGGTVELSHMQNYAWRLNDGSYVLTDDPGFDPWRDLKVEGRKLEAAR